MANNYKQYKKAKKEKNLANKGIAVGSSLTGIGAGTLAGREYLKHLEKKAAEKLGEAAPQNPKLMKKAGIAGLALTGTGAVLAGYSTVKSQRAKRKLKELTENDTKKK